MKYQIVKTAYGALDTAVLAIAGAGNVSTGTQRVVIATDDVNLVAMNTSLDAIEASVAAIDTDATTIIGHVDGIETVLGTIDADTGSIMTAVQLIDDTVFAEDVAAQAADKGIAVLAVRRDADTTLVGDTNDYANLQVDANGYLKVEIFDGGGSHTIDGTVTADLGATDNAVLDAIAASVAAIDTDTSTIITNTGAATTALQIMDDWDNTASDGASVSGDVAHDGVDAGEPVKIGGYAKATAPTAVSADADRVNAWFDLSGRLSVWDGGLNMSIDDGGNSITVDGTVAVTGVATDAKLDTIIGHVDGVEGILTTIDADTGGMAVSLALVDDVVFAEDVGATAADKGLHVLAVRRDADTTLVDTTNDYASLQVDARGLLKVEAFSGEALPVTLTSTTVTGTVAVTQSGTWDEVGINDSGNSITVDNATISVVGSGTEATAQRVTIATDSTGVLSVDDNGGSITVDGTITEASGAAIAASLSVMDDWDNAASDGASISGDVAHDSADAGEPAKIGYKAYSPDGTTPGTAVAELDRTNAKSDLDGLLYVQTMSPRNFSYHDDDAAAVTTDGTAAADPGDGFAVFITDIIFSIGAATASSIFLEEGSTKILGPYYLEAVAGRGVALHFTTPKRCTASTAILVTNTGSILFSIDILGFVSAV